jgi:hypothetical protein
VNAAVIVMLRGLREVPFSKHTAFRDCWPLSNFKTCPGAFSCNVSYVSAFWGKADMEIALRNVHLNNFLVFPLYMTRYRIIVLVGTKSQAPLNQGRA